MEAVLLIAAIIAVAFLGAVFVSALRSGGWSKSSRGNPTTTFGGSRITVFPSASGNLWKFCIADPADKTPPYFSEWYESEDAAKAEAMAMVAGRAPSHPTYREQKEARTRSDAPDILRNAERHYTEMEKAVAHFAKLKAPDQKKFDRLIERLNHARNLTQHAHHVLIDCDADEPLKAQAAQIPLKIIDLKAEALKLQPATPLASS